MKVATIKTTPLLLPFRQPYHWAGRVDYGAAVVLVEVEAHAVCQEAKEREPGIWVDIGGRHFGKAVEG